jgi:hypothetical protein
LAKAVDGLTVSRRPTSRLGKTADVTPVRLTSERCADVLAEPRHPFPEAPQWRPAGPSQHHQTVLRQVETARNRHFMIFFNAPDGAGHM